MANVMIQRWHGRYTLATLVCTAAAFNVGKAVHIDDTAYLEMARGILLHPLRPMSVLVNWAGFAQPASIVMNQPPLWFYALAGTMRLFGESEIALHLMMAVVSALTIVAFHRLAVRVGQPAPLAVTALFALGPALLPGQNLMTDVPLVLCWIICFHALIVAGAAAPHRSRHYAIAGAAAAAACVLKYPSLALVPAIAAMTIVRRQWRALWAIAIPIATLALWSGWNYLEYGGIHLTSRPSEFQWSQLASHAIEWIGGVGVAVPASVILLAARPWRRWRALVWIVSLAGGAAMFVAVRIAAPRYPQNAALWAIFMFGGLACLLESGAAAVSEWRIAPPAMRDEIQALVVWIGAAACIIVFAPFMAMRHVLLVVPPLLLIAGRSLIHIRAPRLTLAIAISITAILGCSLAAADYAYADIYRRYAASISAALPRDGSQTWTVGHWGWQWYTGKQGWLEYDQHSTELHIGDTVVEPAVLDEQRITREDMARLRVVTRIGVPAHGLTTLRTARRNPWGGYYAMHWDTGALPFSFSSGAVEVFTIYKVDR